MTGSRDTDSDQYVHVPAPQSSPVAPVAPKALPDASRPGGGPPAPDNRGWGDLTEALLREDLGRAERLRERHLRGARTLSAVSWALCSVGAVSAALCILSDVLFRSTAATAVLAGVSGVCNALQRVPGPGETSARLYDLAARADVATARIASILDTPRPNREDAGTVLSQVNALVSAAQTPIRTSTTPLLAPRYP